MASYRAPAEWQEWSEWMAAGLHGRSRWRLPVLMFGILFAGGRRVVTSWLRAAGVSPDFRNYYYVLGSVGRRWYDLGWRVLALVVDRALSDQSRVLLAIDDSPTKRSDRASREPECITTRHPARPEQRSATDMCG